MPDFELISSYDKKSSLTTFLFLSLVNSLFLLVYSSLANSISLYVISFSLNFAHAYLKKNEYIFLFIS